MPGQHSTRQLRRHEQLRVVSRRHRARRRVVAGIVAPLMVFALIPAAALLVGAQAAGALTLQNQLFRETPPDLHHLDPYRLDQVTLAGGHNTYDKRGEGNNEVRNDITGDYNQIEDTLKLTQTVEIDVWTDGGNFYVNHGPGFLYASPNHNNCGKGGNYNSGRDKDLYSCLEGLRHWHDRHPNHPLTIIKLEMKNGFSGASPQQLEDVFRFRDVGLAPLLFTPGDLMSCHVPGCTQIYKSPEAAAQAGNWPKMSDLRGRFMVSIVSGAFALGNPPSFPTNPPPASTGAIDLGFYNYLWSAAKTEFGYLKDVFASLLGPALQSLVGKDDGPVTYARAMGAKAVQGFFFPTLLMQRARPGEDPRITDFPNQSDFQKPEIAKWVVTFDMESGYLPRPYGNGYIDAERLQWIRTNHYLDFVSVHTPALPCNNDSLCLQTLTNIMCPPTVRDAYFYRCQQQWANAEPWNKVNIPLGRAFTAQLVNDYKVNVVDSDQERLGLVDPKPLPGTVTQSSSDPLDNTIKSYYQSVATWAGFTDVFGTDPAGGLWHRSFGPRGWSSWASLPTPGSLGNYPPSVAARPNGLFVLTAVTRDGRMWTAFMVQGVLSGWTPVASPEHFVNTTLLATAGANLHLFALTQRNSSQACNPVTPAAPPAGPECGVWHFTLRAPFFRVESPEFLGGPSAIPNQVDQGAPVSAISTGGNSMWVHAKSYDGQIWGDRYDGMRWSGWNPSPPARATAASSVRYSPTVAVHHNPTLNVDLYYLGGDLQFHWSNSIPQTVALWTNAAQIPGPVVSPYSSGSSVSFIDGETDLYMTGLNGILYHKRFDSRTAPPSPVGLAPPNLGA